MKPYFISPALKYRTPTTKAEVESTSNKVAM